MGKINYNTCIDICVLPSGIVCPPHNGMQRQGDEDIARFACTRKIKKRIDEVLKNKSGEAAWAMRSRIFADQLPFIEEASCRELGKKIAKDVDCSEPPFIPVPYQKPVREVSPNELRPPAPVPHEPYLFGLTQDQAKVIGGTALGLLALGIVLRTMSRRVAVFPLFIPEEYLNDDFSL